MNRTVCWWSAGAASAVAAKVALEKDNDAVIAYCDTSSSEHPDNIRFLEECESWYGKPILRLKSEKYKDTWEVFEKTKWLVGVAGARCTTELKKKVRRGFQRPDDRQVFGFSLEEGERARRFTVNNPEVIAWFPLIEAGLSHADCLAALKRASIQVPAMYRLGYKNNNCIGCVKGGAGYWNKVRRDFPEVFERMSKLERSLDAAMLKKNLGKERLRVFLDELDPASGRYEAEEEVQCGVACEAVPK